MEGVVEEIGGGIRHRLPAAVRKRLVSIVDRLRRVGEEKLAGKDPPPGRACWRVSTIALRASRDALLTGTQLPFVRRAARESRDAAMIRRGFCSTASQPATCGLIDAMLD